MTTTDEPLLEVPVPDVSPASAASALLAGIGLVMIGNSLGGSVVGIRAELEAFGGLTIGVIMAAYFGGFLFGSSLSKRLLASVGHIRVFAALASVASTIALIQAIAVHPLVWGPTRFITGACASGIYVVAESWLNDIATPSTRGRILAAYMFMSMGGMAIGQALLVTASPRDTTLFIIASVLVSLSLVPVSLSTTSAPPVSTPEPMSLRELIGIAPIGVVGMFLVGTAAGTILGMGAVYATRAGFTSNETALFLLAPMIGSVVFQFPLGILSDRVPRRGLLAVTAAISAIIALSMMRVDATSLLGTFTVFVLGGCMFPLYSLAVAYANDWVPQSKMVAASSSLVLVNGTGAILGPILTATIFMLTDQALWIMLSAIHALMAAYIGYRILVRDALPVEQQRPWVPVSSRATSAVAVLAKPMRKRPAATDGQGEGSNRRS